KIRRKFAKGASRGRFKEQDALQRMLEFCPSSKQRPGSVRHSQENQLADLSPSADGLQWFGSNSQKGAAMKWCPTPRFMAVVTAALLISLLAVSGFAQFQSGNIYGKVQAKDGSVLPGVTVFCLDFAVDVTRLELRESADGEQRNE